MSRIIKCAHCGKRLFITDKTSDGSAGHEAEKFGFIFKMPFLYGHSECKFFCNKDCCKSWFTINVSDENKKEGDATINHLKSQKQQIVEGLCEGLDLIQKAFKSKK